MSASNYIPYSCQQITDDDVSAVLAVLRSEFLTQGPAVPAFESAFASAHEAPYAIAVSNATAALHIGCLALGVGPGSLVWTSPNSFLASANCALYCGADVDFVDIDPASRNISTVALKEKLESASAKGRLPDVVIPVDFAGLSCDMREIRALADQYGFRIIEDASHATGGTYLGKPVGSHYADLTVFSFHAVKVITTGEGGMLLTRDAALARKLELLRSHGMTRLRSEWEGTTDDGWYYEQQSLGFNYRMTDIQAALGISQLRRLREMNQRRRELAQRYNQLLYELPLKLPSEAADRTSAWHLYAVEVTEESVEQRRAFAFRRLRAANIGVNVHYIPIHTQPFYRRRGFRAGDFPNAERYSMAALSLPLFPSMTDGQQDRVVDVLRHSLTESMA